MTELSATTNVEDDAMQLQTIFAKAANAIVEASNLRKEVAQMKEQITALSENVDSLRKGNDELVNELHAIRQEKTEIQNKLWTAEHEIEQLKAQLAEATRLNSEQGSKIAKQQQTIDDFHRLADGDAKTITAHRAEIQGLREHISNVQKAHEQLAREQEGYLDGLRSAHARLGDVVKSIEEPVSTNWTDVKEAVQQEAHGQSEGPFVDQSQSTSSGSASEQPRDESNRFDQVPMAAKDFEY